MVITVQQAFEQLKQHLTSAPVLLLPDPKLPFIVITDASDFIIGAVLSQNQDKNDQPIAFESRKLSLAEQNYPVHEKELLAIVHAIRLWKSYLEGQKFTVVTDHAFLEYIKTQHNLSKRQAHWLETLQASNFEVKYKPGKDNVVADALSHQSHLANISVIIINLVDKEALIKKYQEDKYFAEIYEVLKNFKSANPKQQTKVKNFELKDELLYLKNTSHLAIPSDKNLKSKILFEFHDVPIAGHIGIDKTYAIISQ